MTGDTGDELSPVKRMLLEVRELRARLEAAERIRTEPIAIVGMACRFPGGANSADALWRLLEAGADVISEVPPDRWDVDAFFDADPAALGRMTTRWGGFIDGVDRFDPQFFGLSPREAMSMDPQQRLLLEVAWEALEHAGIAPDQLTARRGGVFVGISSFDYAHLAMSVADERLDGHLAPGISHSASSGRLSYLLGMQGPAISLDTACSSSLMATHLAVQSLRRRESDLALVGGVNAVLLPTFAIGFSRASMMAPDGRCKAFDARADGFVRAEGCGVLTLKRLTDALADGDQVWAVIRGSAANQDGRSSGLTAPNGPAQEAVIRDALADAGIAARQVSYVEAHGTGTSLGDPIEVGALAAVLGQQRDGSSPLLIGSIKSNIGHTEAAAGVAGVMKAALALHYGRLPASLHCQAPNPLIPWRDIPVRVVTEMQPFPIIEGRSIAGVSSFGFTGTNVHLLLERAAVPAPAGPDAPIETATESAVTPYLLPLSARTVPALRTSARQWAEALASGQVPPADACQTAMLGRAALAERVTVVAPSGESLAERLALFAGGERHPDVVQARARERGAASVAFLFSGHGGQRSGMGRTLYGAQPAFRAAIEECEAALRPHLTRSLTSILFEAEPDGGEPAIQADMTHSQPALFAMEYALATLWRSWGVEPDFVAGHSVGEYAAAVIAGVFSLEDGMALVAARGRLMDTLPERGAMLALLAPEAIVEPLLAPHRADVALAAINGPTEFVLSGRRPALEAIAAEAERGGVELRRLVVAQGAHSQLLDPMLDAFEAVARRVRFQPPTLGLVSCLTGAFADADEITTPRYWRRHLRETVRFASAIATLHGAGANVFLEIGPHPMLVGMGARCLPPDSASWLASLRRDRDEWPQVMDSVARLWTAGVAIDWRALTASGGVPRGRRVAMPTYPWEHRRYWLEGAPRPGPRRRGLIASEETGDVPADYALDAHDSGGTDGALAAALREMPRHAWDEALTSFVRREIADLLRIEAPELIERRARLTDLGLDSLMAVELRSRVGRGLGLSDELPATLIFDYPSVESIVRLLHSIFERDAATAPIMTPLSASGTTAAPLGADAIAQLNDDEVEAMLLARLEDLEGTR